MAKKITQTGPVGLRGIRNPDLYNQNNTTGFSQDQLDDINKSYYESTMADYNTRHGHANTGNLANNNLYTPQTVSPDSGLSDYGQSSYDQGVLINASPDEMQNQRAENEGTFTKWAAGFGKMAVLAGTTALDGTIGTLTGIANAAKTAAEGGDASDTFGALWNNPFSKAMQNINNWSEQAMPNYQSTEESNSPWYSNIFTANFWADQVVRNLGFMAGAYLSGRAFTAAASGLMNLGEARNIFKGATLAADSGASVDDIVNAYKNGDQMLGQLAINKRLADSAKQIKNADAMLQWGSAFTGAFGEAKQEAIQNSADWLNTTVGHINNYANTLDQQNLNKLYAQRPDLFTHSYDDQGNDVITPSDTAKSIASQLTDQSFNRNDALAMASKDAAKMGNVDFMLNMPILTLSDMVAFGRFMSRGFKTASKLNPIIKQVADDGTTSYIAKDMGRLSKLGKVFQTAIAEGPYEEMMQQVAQTAPGYKYSSDINSYYGAKIDPTAEDQTMSWLKASAKAMADTYGSVDQWEQGFVGALSGVLGVPMVRSAKTADGKFQSPLTVMGGAIGDMREISETNKASKDLANQLNTVIQSPERLNYYNNLVRQAHYGKAMDIASRANDNFSFQNASDASLISDIATFTKADRLQDLKDMINGISNITEDDVDKDGGIRDITKDAQTGKNEVFPDNMSSAEVVQKLKDNAEQINKTIDTYSKAADNLQTIYGGRVSQDGLDEMTYLTTHINGLENRFTDLRNTIKDNLGNLDMSKEYTNEEGNNVTLQDILSKPTVEAMNTLASYPKVLSEITQDYNDYTSKNKILNAPDILNNIQDLQKLSDRRNDMIDILSDYQSHPEKVDEDILKQRQNVSNLIEQKAVEGVTTDLNKATNQQEFNLQVSKDLVNNDNNQINTAIQNMADSGNTLAKNYLDINGYLSDVHKELVKSGATEQEIKDATKLLHEHSFTANDLSEAAHPDTFVNNANVSDMFDDNLDRKQAAINLAQQAMYNVNMDRSKQEDYKSIFAQPNYTKPVEQTNPIPVAPNKETTGADSTGTTYEAKDVTLGEIGDDGNFTPAPKPKTTVVGTTESNILEDNKGTVQTPEKNKNYLFPIIPQYQQDAMKDNLFIPMNTVTDKATLVKYYNDYRRKQAAEGHYTYSGDIKEADIDFTNIYNYLDSKGAFDYVNKGNLPVNGEVSFVIDPNYTGSQNAAKPTIFMAHNGQIIGSLPEAVSLIKNTPGLQALTDRIYNGWSKSNKKILYTHNETTHVSKIMNGKIMFGNTIRDLNTVEGIADNPKLGVIKNGKLETGDPKIDGLADTSGIVTREGALYLLVPNSAGGYSIANVRVKHLSDKDMPKGSNLPIYARTKSAIEALANAAVTQEGNETNTAFSEALSDINKVLYLGNYNFHVNNSNNGKLLFIEHVTGNDQVDTKVVQLTDREGTPLANVADNIENTLRSTEPVVQVSVNQLNSGKYNQYLSESGALESNIDKAEVVGSWFTTNYIDDKGNEVKAVNPTVGTKPVLRDNNGTYNPDNGTIVDKNGIETPASELQNDINQLKLSGIPIPTDGIMRASSGRLINMNTGKYLTNKEEFNYNIDQLVQHNQFANRLIQDQTNVDKTKTDNEHYFIKEEDGTYHEYSRVHQALGSNSTTEFENKTTAALQNGTLVDGVVRDFFNGEEITKPSNMSQEAFDSLINRLKALKKSFIKNGETVLANNIVLYHKYNDGRRIAGEVDLMTIDKTGRVNIYDVKTSHHPFGFFEGKAGTTNYFEEAGSFKNVSDKRYYSKQLAAYSNLLYSHYGLDTNHLGIIPFVINEKIDDSKDTEEAKLARGVQTVSPSSIIYEKESPIRDSNGIIVNRRMELNKDEAFKDIENQIPREAGKPVNVGPKVSTSDSAINTTPTVPFTKAENNEKMESTGYVEVHNTNLPGLEGTVFQTGLTKIGTTANGTDIYLTRMAAKGMHGELIGYRYYVVTPNGYANLLKIGGIRGPVDISTDTVTSMVKDLIKSSGEALDKLNTLPTALQSNPTIITLPGTQSSNKEASNKMVDSVNNATSKNGVTRAPRRKPGTRNRLVTKVFEKGNIESELNWLNRVLPQLSMENKVRIHRGLINVAELGSQAWGQFKDGIIHLSDTASSGTVYHEAFHAVFNLLLSNNDRTILYNEAKNKYGDLSNENLEEKLAEDFRNYTATRESPSLGNKIGEFFKDLFAKVFNWNKVESVADSYFRQINEGKYSSNDLSVPSLSEITNKVNSFDNTNKVINFADIDPETLDYMKAKGWTEDIWNNLTDIEKRQAIKCATF